MNKDFLLLASAGVTITVLACAGASPPRPGPVSPACAALSDSLSKYVSVDALPFAHLIGTPGRPIRNREPVHPGARSGVQRHEQIQPGYKTDGLIERPLSGRPSLARPVFTDPS